MREELTSVNVWKKKLNADLPPKTSVLARNQAITAKYADLYLREPGLYKWAGMAAFASHHIGSSLKLNNWHDRKIKSLKEVCQTDKRSLGDDMQIIRIVNNAIFEDIGWVHAAFCEMEFKQLRNTLKDQANYRQLIPALEKLNQARTLSKSKNKQSRTSTLIWEANTDILWHEQSEVVQPLFDQLGSVFSKAMTLCASFDYQINDRPTDWRTHSTFMLHMLFRGFSLVKQSGFIPRVTDLKHRWHWIENSLLEIWKQTDQNNPGLKNKMTSMANSDLQGSSR